MKNKVSGVYTAIITPFDDEDTIDEEGLRHNIRFQIKNGINGIVSLGTTGEAPTLTSKEKESIIRISREETANRIPLMVGTGSYATSQTIENTRQAQLLGADSALIVTPYYNRPTQSGLYQHFKAIAEAVDIPIIVYNIQSRTGQNLQPDTLRRLADISTIVGVKEGSGNLTQICEVIETIGRHRADFSILSADDALTLPVMMMGGDGVISVLSNLFPQEVVTLIKAVQSEEYTTARDTHYQLMPLIRSLFMETNPIPIKAAMNFFKMAAGHCRLPLCPLSPQHEKQLKNLLESYLKNFSHHLAQT